MESQFTSWTGPFPTNFFVGFPLLIGVVTLFKSSSGAPPSMAMSRIGSLSVPILLSHGPILGHLMSAPYAVLCPKSSCNFVELAFLFPGIFICCAAFGVLLLFVIVLPAAWFINLCGKSAMLRSVCAATYVVVFALAASPWVFETGQVPSSHKLVACPLHWLRLDTLGIIDKRWSA